MLAAGSSFASLSLYSSDCSQFNRNVFQPCRTGTMFMAICKLFFLLLLEEVFSLDLHTKTHYKAAVYEHRPMLISDPKVLHSRHTALALMYKNVAVYEEQVKAAAVQGVQIIVFPEDGIHGFNFTRASIRPFLELEPAPSLKTWNPCQESHHHNDTEILQRLSCMALNSRMYVVANLGTKQSCNRLDSRCPPDGQYQFNTDVVFSADGSLVARYHKQNLYFEAAFDSPHEMEYAVFDTPFASGFGLFTCFDILFKKPAVNLITQHRAKHVLYPTAWMNQLPLLSAIQIQRGFASSFNINILAANIHEITLGMTGSGIYTPVDSYYYYDMESQEGRLIVAAVPVNPSRAKPLKKNVVPKVSKAHSPMVLPLERQVCEMQDTRVHCGGNPIWAHKPTAAFFSQMMYDNFTLVSVAGIEGDLQVCSNSLCCHLIYSRAALSGEHYALGVFDGLHTVHGTYYLQVCALVKCGETCGQEISEASGVLAFHLWGNFSTSRVFPLLLMSGMTLNLADQWGWAGDRCYMSKEETRTGLVTAALYGRWYEKD